MSLTKEFADKQKELEASSLSQSMPVIKLKVIFSFQLQPALKIKPINVLTSVKLRKKPILAPMLLFRQWPRLLALYVDASFLGLLTSAFYSRYHIPVDSR
jgi:hypothetical protein